MSPSRKPQAEPGAEIETIPAVGVMKGRILAIVLVPRQGGRPPLRRFRCQLLTPGGNTFEHNLLRSEFVVLAAAPKDEDPAGARAERKRRGTGGAWPKVPGVHQVKP